MTDIAYDHRGYLERFGAILIDNGYQIIPIQVGKKAPGFDGWQKSRSTKPQLDEWLTHGHRNSGLGILTKHTPAIDIDVLDDEAAERLENWVKENISFDAPVRIGQYPKRLLVFQTDEPFRKISSARYKDQFDDVHRVEILGDGQQFVAYHKHPDTGRPYVWTEEGMEPIHIEANDLPTLDAESAQALIDYFDELAEELGWEKVSSARRSAGEFDPDNPFVEDSSPVSVSDDELRARLLLIPGAEDYDTWIQIGMALHHQYDGEETGHKLWHEWAETADNYDPDALDRRWEDFSIQGKRRAPVTARYILLLSKEAVARTTAERILELQDAFLSAKDLVEWDRARQMSQLAEIDALARASLASIARQCHEKLTGAKISLVEIKKAISYQPKRMERTPTWCKPWVYDTSDDRFFHTDMKIATTQQGFNAMHDREALTKKDVLDGRTSPSSTASALALNLYKIPIVQGRRYEPGRDSIFHEPDGVFVNTYPEHEVPEMPEKLLPRDKRNITRVQRHLEHLIEYEDEQRMFLDWLSWVVQNPGKHVNYAILLQGVEGDGKSFWGRLMREVMGMTNVRMVNAQILESDFTDWTVGQCLTCIEEVRLIKPNNKYEVLNRIKPFITNDVIEVHPKGKAPYNAKNTTSYLLFSNYKDALPIDADSRRYMILFTRWQSKERLDEFKRDNPDYYDRLFKTFEESSPALRKWLMEHEQRDDFNPMGDAPETPARSFMIRQSQPEFIQCLNDLIEDSASPFISEDLLETSALSDTMVSVGLDFPAPKAMTSMLQRYKWEFMGRIRIDGQLRRFWTRRIEKFQSLRGDILEIDHQLVREHVRKIESAQGEMMDKVREISQADCWDEDL